MGNFRAILAEGVEADIAFEGDELGFEEASKLVDAEKLRRGIPVTESLAPSVLRSDVPELFQQPVGSREQRIGEREGVSVVPGEFTAPGIFRKRADIARNKKDADKLRKFQEFAPGTGAFLGQDPDSPDKNIILVGIPGTDEFVQLDDPGTSTRQDFADFLGLLGPEQLGGAIAGQAGVGAIIAATPGLREAGGAAFAVRLLLRTAAVGTGTTIGSLTQREVEISRGFEERDPLADRLVEAGGEGVAAMLSELAMGGIEFGVKVAFPGFIKRSFIKPTQPQRELIEIHRDLGLDPPTVADFHPITQSQAMQAAQTGTFAARQMAKRIEQPIEVLNRRLANVGDVSILNTRSLEGILSGFEDDILRPLSDKITPRSVPIAQEARRGLRTYEVAAREANRRRYRELGETADQIGVTFDVSPAAAKARESLVGTVQRTRLEFQGEAAASRVTQIDPPTGEFKDALETLVKIDPILKGISGAPKSSAFEQAQLLRSRFASMSRDPLLGRFKADASELAGLLDDAINSPILPPQSSAVVSQFTRSLSRADAAYKRRLEILDKSYVREILTGEKPSVIGEHLIDPTKVEMIRAVRRLGGAPALEAVRQGYLRRLMSNPGDILSTLANPKNQSGLNILLKRGERQTLETVGKQFQEYSRAPLVRQMNQGLTDAAQVFRFMSRGKVADAAAFVERAGGKNSPQGRSLQAGALSMIIQGAQDFRDGAFIIRPKRFEVMVRNLDDSGFIDAIFTEANAKVIRSMRTAISFLNQSSGVGESMLRAQVSQGLAGPAAPIVRPDRFLGSMIQLFKNYTNARSFLFSDVGRAAVGAPLKLKRVGRPQGFDFSLLKVMVDGSAIALNKAKDDAAEMYGLSRDSLNTAAGTALDTVSPRQWFNDFFDSQPDVTDEELEVDVPDVLQPRGDPFSQILQ